MEKIKITKENLKTPVLEKNGTAIVFQRHEVYDRIMNRETSGSLSPESAKEAYNTAKDFFTELIDQGDPQDVMILFTSSDTQYDKNGYRSIETADQARQAAIDVLNKAGLDPSKHVINLNPEFKTKRFEATDSDVRPMAQIREPQIFEQSPEYIAYLQEKYGAADEITDEKGETRRIGLNTDAFDAHESDREKEVREALGAEGVYDILDRTKKGIDLQQRYAEWFHAANPGKKLVIWSASHYDTISPLVKDAAGIPFTQYVGVEYGAGVILSIPPQSSEATFKIGSEAITLKKRVSSSLGKQSLGQTLQP